MTDFGSIRRESADHPMSRIAFGLARLGAPGEMAAFLLLKGRAAASRAASREEEAALALQSLAIGLVAAALLFALAIGFDSLLLRVFALSVFAANLVRLLPLRRLAGGRLFPGFAWPARQDHRPGLRLRLSLLAERGVRRFARRAGIECADAPKPLAALLGPALVAMIATGFAAVCVVALLLPAAALAAAVVLWIVATFAALILAPMLDRGVLDRHVREGLAPRREVRSPPAAAESAKLQRPGFATRAAAKAALAGYLLALAAATLGAGAALSGLAA